jgi:hypothetical protein
MARTERRTERERKRAVMPRHRCIVPHPARVSTTSFHAARPPS